MSNKNQLPFGRKNYIIMLVGMGVLILGFTLMGMDKEEYGFGVLGLTIGPITVVWALLLNFLPSFPNLSNNLPHFTDWLSSLMH